MPNEDELIAIGSSWNAKKQIDRWGNDVAQYFKVTGLSLRFGLVKRHAPRAVRRRHATRARGP